MGIFMVDYIYKKNPKIELDFSEDILEEEKEKILICSIKYI